MSFETLNLRLKGMVLLTHYFTLESICNVISVNMPNEYPSSF